MTIIARVSHPYSSRAWDALLREHKARELDFLPVTASTISGVCRASTFGTEPSISFDSIVNRVALAGV